MPVELPGYVTVVVLFTDLLVAGLVVAGVGAAARRAGLSTASRRRLVVAVAGTLAAWFALAAVVATARLPGLHPLVLGLLGGPVVVGAGLLAASPTWRRVVRATPQTWLVAGQCYRVVGAVFLVVWGLGGLPAYFALPAGVGDIVTGAGALVVGVLVARRTRGWRAGTVGWNAFGLADLVVAVGAGSGLLAGPLSTVLAAETSTAIVTWFPLGAIPLFLVPISATLHLYSLSNLAADAPSTDAPAVPGVRPSGRD